jgi:hypothetical protein
MAEALLVFKPELWSKTILKELEVITGMRKHSDYSFAQEIKYGTRLHITKLGDTQIRNYTQGVDITFDEVNGTEVELVIDQQRYFGKYYDDIDAKQAIPGAVEQDMAETAKVLALDADEFVSARLYQAVTATGSTIGKSAAAITPNEKNVLKAIEEGLVHLYSNNVPVSTEIWGEVSPKMFSELRIYLTELATQNLDLMKRGIIGKYNNVNVCIENRLPVANGVKYNFLRTGKAFAFAEQLDKVAKTDKEKGFGTYFKGLYVYGGVVVRPEEIFAVLETTTEADSTFLTR